MRQHKTLFISQIVFTSPNCMSTKSFLLKKWKKLICSFNKFSTELNSLENRYILNIQKIDNRKLYS